MIEEGDVVKVIATESQLNSIGIYHPLITSGSHSVMKISTFKYHNAYRDVTLLNGFILPENFLEKVG